MIEIAEFRPEEIDEAIEGLDGLQGIIAPFLRNVNKDGMGEQDVQQFVRHLTLAKHALIAMGDFLEGKMKPNTPLTLDELREMNGEPVWDNSLKTWGIVVGEYLLYRNREMGRICGNNYFRHRPEEGTP